MNIEQKNILKYKKNIKKYLFIRIIKLYKIQINYEKKNPKKNLAQNFKI
jgi:hypothetical protein